MNTRVEEKTNGQPVIPAQKLMDQWHTVRCGMCARSFDVDEETYEFVSEAIATGLDNPFRCEVCKAEYDELAYEG